MTIGRLAISSVIAAVLCVSVRPAWSSGAMFLQSREIPGDPEFVIFGSVKDDRGKYRQNKGAIEMNFRMRKVAKQTVRRCRWRRGIRPASGAAASSPACSSSRRMLSQRVREETVAVK
jgi:hypothetical protein